MSNDDMLNSWKEVANYLGRGVRTVQRWEQELSLPVRRPWGKSRSAVIALKTEIDEWLHRSKSNPALVHTSPSAVEPQLSALSEKLALPENPDRLNAVRSRRSELHDTTAALIATMEQLVSRSNDLCQRSMLITDRMNQMMAAAAKKQDKSYLKNGDAKNGHKQWSLAS